MPIDPTSNNPLSRVNGSRGAETTQRQMPTQSARTPGESTQTAPLSRLNTQDSTHDINATRVAEIRQGIADGTLRFDSGRIADGIIASARELAGDN